MGDTPNDENKEGGEFLSAIFPTDDEGNIDLTDVPEYAHWLAETITVELRLAEVGMLVKLLSDACSSIQQALAEHFGHLADTNFDELPEEARETIAQGIAMGETYEGVGNRLSKAWHEGGYNDKVKESMGGVIASEAEAFLDSL
jgi:hypothetical protein